MMKEYRFGQSYIDKYVENMKKDPERTSLEHKALCKSADKLVIGNDVTYIPDKMFKDTSKWVVIEEGSQSREIDAYAFSGNKKMDIRLSELARCTKIDEGAFSGCKNQQASNLPENLEEIGPCAFYGTGWRGSQYMTLPDSIKKISEFWNAGKDGKRAKYRISRLKGRDVEELTRDWKPEAKAKTFKPVHGSKKVYRFACEVTGINEKGEWEIDVSGKYHTAVKSGNLKKYPVLREYPTPYQQNEVTINADYLFGKNLYGTSSVTAKEVYDALQGKSVEKPKKSINVSDMRCGEYEDDEIPFT